MTLFGPDRGWKWSQADEMSSDDWRLKAPRTSFSSGRVMLQIVSLVHRNFDFAKLTW